MAYGVIGLMFMLAVFAWANYQAWDLYRRMRLPKEVWLFTLLGTVLLAVASFFESYVIMKSGVYVVTIILAPVCSVYLKEVLARAKAKQMSARLYLK